MNVKTVLQHEAHSVAHSTQRSSEMQLEEEEEKRFNWRGTLKMEEMFLIQKKIKKNKYRK